MKRALDPRPAAPAPADAELMASVAAGDLSALGVLYDRYHVTVRDFLLRAVPGRHDADDLVQETFLTLIKAAPSYDGRARASGFIIGVAVQLVRRRRRFLGRWSEVLWELQEICGSAVSSPEDDAQAAEDLAAVDHALARMSESKRLTYLMVEREGLSGEEVAAALGIPIGTVWTRLHHARAALQRALIRRGTR